MSPQQVITGPAPMEGVERTNAVVVRGQGAGVDRGRNCYACRGFGHIARHYRSRRRERLMEERRVEYGGGRIEKINDCMNNLKGIENLELLN